MGIELSSTHGMDGFVTWPILGLCFSVGMVVALIVVWLFSKFQTKHAAEVARKQLKAEIDRVDKDVREMQSSLAEIGKNVSYIRGRLEPKN